MALQGTLSDFALPDILQLIGIQRKTGVLTMENDEDTVTVQFFQGQVVGADTRSRKLEDLLGSVLVRTGKITEAQLGEVLAIQRETLQRLGYVLVKSGYLSEEELREALRIQINQIVYRLFRWRDGRYHFVPMDHLEYDRSLTIPVSAETVLMEAARMIDEWPVIERRIKSPQAVFQKTEAGRAYESTPSAPASSEWEFDLDLFGEPNSAGSKDAPSPPTPDEKEILALLDGRSTVQDIVDRVPLGEFDVHRTLYDLLGRGLAEEVIGSDEPGHAAGGETARKLAVRGLVAAVFGLALLGAMTARLNPASPWAFGPAAREAQTLRRRVSQGRLERIDQAVRVFYLDAGAIPGDLRVLVQGGYLSRSDLLDPWGREYGFRSSPEGYFVFGRDASGDPDPDVSLTHRLTGAQRMLLEGPATPFPGGSDSRP